MNFVQGLVKGVYVGQTTIQYLDELPSEHISLKGFNLALHVQDNASRVQQHRMMLLNQLAGFGVNKLTWMTQTHSTICHTVNDEVNFIPLEGDSLITQRKGHALMMMTADCLPIVLINKDGSEVANIHAGWRGLADGIIENTIESMQSATCSAWLGAAISQPCFEVGAEVKKIFCDKYPALASAFEYVEQIDPSSEHMTEDQLYQLKLKDHGKLESKNTNKYHDLDHNADSTAFKTAEHFAEKSQSEENNHPPKEKYLADLYAIARYILNKNGVDYILGGDQCTYRQQDQYYSYRRNSKTGRMATFVFIR